MLKDAAPAEGIPLLRPPTEGQNITADYAHLGLTLGRHPLALLRSRLQACHVVTAAQLSAMKNGAQLRTAGLVIGRQRPGTASGVTFVTLEDETGQTNVVVWLQVAEAYPRTFLQAQLMEVQGKLQREGQVMHIIAHQLVDRSRWLGALQVRSRDFH